MTDDREEFEKARQEQRLARATYTAAEVKVLTEVAMRLGRKEAGEQIAEALLNFASNDILGRADISFDRAAAIAREVASQDPTDAPEPRTDPSGYSDLPQDPQAGREALCGDYPAPCNCDDPTTHDGH